MAVSSSSQRQWQSWQVLLPLLSLTAVVQGQMGGTRPVPSANATAATGTYSTRSFNPNVPLTTPRPNTDYSDQALAFLWNQVGPIKVGPVTTTVSPTPEPSAFPKPGTLHPLVASNFEGGAAQNESLKGLKLPKGFMWGVASSAYQIEGAAKDEGKGPSIWDFLAHRVPGIVVDNSNADVAAQHYYLYKQDIARLKALGIPTFSPSISWPRIFPFGKGPVNEAGVKHYDDVIQELVKNDITPIVTLFHWDTPLALFNEYGGWNDAQIVDDFVNYAKFVITKWDKYVPVWYTINEPQYCNWEHSTFPLSKYLPIYNNITEGVHSRFLCGHYTLLAHAKVAKWYHEEFKGRGRISFKNSGNYYEANTTSSGDQIARQRQFDFSVGWFGGPWTDGDYPKSLKDTLGDLLPKFTAEEKALIKGSCDFYALDGYTSYTASASKNYEQCIKDPKAPGFPECSSSSQSAPDKFPLGPASDPSVNWLASTPTGIRKYLSFLTKEYFPAITDIVVAEFGFAEPFESKLQNMQSILWDLRRADYYQNYMDNILAAIHFDKVNVTGVWGWAIYDNFEWFDGLSVRFGLQYVNYTDLTRTPKASMFQFLNWFKEHGMARTANATVKLF